MRLLLLILLSPFRFVSWAIRRLYVRFRGYDVLRVDLHGRLPDRRGSMSFLGAVSGESPGPALLDVLVALDRARRDPRIRAVLVEIGALAAGLARAEEVRAALRKVRDAGKRVVVHMEEGGLAAYSIALGANEIVLPPGGGLNVTGVASEVILLRGLLDRAGVRAWMRARGKYKSARETFSESEMTAANREMTESLVSDLYEQLVEAIATSRSLEPAAVRARLDEGPFLAEEAKELGLVDQIRYFDELEETLEAELGSWKPLRLGQYLKLSSHLVKRGKAAVVAFVEVSGAIRSGRGVPGRDGLRATGSRKFVEAMKAIADDPKIRAVVLRVDSPGGSALASDLMWRALSRARDKKPVVVSMADVAASGGYFVSGIRDTPILASSATLTGSIGVLAGKFDVSTLYEKLGVKKEMVGKGRRAGFFSEARGFSEDDLAKLDADLDAHYRHFLSRMAEGRNKSVDEIHAVAQGRVWTGRQALANGLVDGHGGLMDALARARELMGVPADTPLLMTSPSTERSRLPFRVEWRTPENVLPGFLGRLVGLAELFAGERALALLPFEIRFE